MNKAEKSLRWVVNQIPDFKPTTDEEKMLVAIKLYSEAGAEEIRRLEVENAKLKEMLSCVKSGRVSKLKAENASFCERLKKAVEIPCRVGDKVYCIHGMSNPELLEWQVNEIRITDHNYMLQLGRAGTKDYRSEASQFYGKWWFTELEAAEARLAELKGEEKNG